MRDEVKLEGRRQKAEGSQSESSVSCLPSALCLLPFLLSSLILHPSSLISPCVAQTGGDAVDGRGQRVIQIFVLHTVLFAAEERDLNQAHRINIRITQANRAREHRIAAQQFSLLHQAQNHPVRALELFDDQTKDTFAHALV